MQTGVNHPAQQLRQKLAALSPRGFIRWDMSGRALLICDAPRRQDAVPLLRALENDFIHSFVDNDLLYLDLSPKGYEALLDLPLRTQFPPLAPSFWQEQLLLQRILSHPASGGDADIPLLRKGLIASVLSDAEFFLFLKTLRGQFAQGLRLGSLKSCKICAHFLYERLLP